MIRISKKLLDALQEHGKTSYDDEACGVLYGASRNGHKKVLAFESLVNSRATERHKRFLVTLEDYRRAEAAASTRGMELLGFYHSHPDHPAYPSSYDLAHAWPFFSYLIVSVIGGEPKDVRSFVMQEDRKAFVEEDIGVE